MPVKSKNKESGKTTVKAKSFHCRIVVGCLSGVHGEAQVATIDFQQFLFW